MTDCGTIGCNGGGPGWATPMDAFHFGPREKYLIITCPAVDSTKLPDMIASVDVDPASDTYCKVVSSLKLPYYNDEVHHSGWNACSSCYCSKQMVERRFLIVPCLISSRIYIVDCAEPRELKLHKIIEPELLFQLDVSFPHTSHCLANGIVMLSTLGRADGSNRGNFLLLNARTFDPISTWPKQNATANPPFNYDFWYQPAWNVMVSSEWAAPNVVRKGFRPECTLDGSYGHHLNVWNWEEQTLRERIELVGDDVPFANKRCLSVIHKTGNVNCPSDYIFIHDCKPLSYRRALFSIWSRNDTSIISGWQIIFVVTNTIHSMVRFLHDPKSRHGFVLTALGSSLYHFWIEENSGKFLIEKVVSIESHKIANGSWLLPKMPGLMADMIQIGGLVNAESGIQFEDIPNEELQARTRVKGVPINGGTQMVQLSLDGRRLYVTTSLFRPWDYQLQPSLRQGAQLLRVDIENDGGMKLNENFLVDFGSLPDGPYLAHEMRFPGGDCTSDIWLKTKC